MAGRSRIEGGEPSPAGTWYGPHGPGAEITVNGVDLGPGFRATDDDVTGTSGLMDAAIATLAACGVEDGHVAIDFVDERRIQELNRVHRGVDKATDVLSFPVDGTAPTAGPRELGDVVICPEHTRDVIEAVVHGVLHLCGHDHERDEGEMLALQERVLAGLR